MSGCVSSLLLGLVSRGLGMESIPQGCLVGVMFIVALSLPWCEYLEAQEGVMPQL